MHTSLEINPPLPPPGNEDNPFWCKDAAGVEPVSREQAQGAFVSQSKKPQETQCGNQSDKTKGWGMSRGRRSVARRQSQTSD